MKTQRTEFWKDSIKGVQRQIDLGTCHSSWGNKRIAKIEKAINKKEDAIRKRRK